MRLCRAGRNVMLNAKMAMAAFGISLNGPVRASGNLDTNTQIYLLRGLANFFPAAWMKWGRS